ncbi:MAG: hypothetical protein ACXVZO_05250 [Gaiellaceae bacterium]
MEAWKIEKSWNCPPVTGNDRDPYAHAFTLARSGHEVQTTVEFSDGGRSGSAPRAFNAMRQYLRREGPPPRRLLVARDGTVSELDA